MFGKSAFIGSIAILVGSMLITNLSYYAYASEGSSYRLYSEYPNVATGGPLTGTDVMLQEGTAAGKAKPLVGSSFQVTSSPPMGSSGGGGGGGNEGGSGGGGGGGGSGGGGGGGRRNPPAIPTDTPSDNPQSEPPADRPRRPSRRGPAPSVHTSAPTITTTAQREVPSAPVTPQPVATIAREAPQEVATEESPQQTEVTKAKPCMRDAANTALCALNVVEVGAIARLTMIYNFNSTFGSLPAFASAGGWTMRPVLIGSLGSLKNISPVLPPLVFRKKKRKTA